MRLFLGLLVCSAIATFTTACGGGGGGGSAVGNYSGNYSTALVLQSSTCATQPLNFSGLTLEVFQDENAVSVLLLFTEFLRGFADASGFVVNGDNLDPVDNCVFRSTLVADEITPGVTDELSISMSITLVSCRDRPMNTCTADYFGTATRFNNSVVIRSFDTSQ